MSVQERLSGLSVAARVMILTAAALAAVGALWLVARFIAPPPPDRIVIAAGGAGGAYHSAAEAYRDRLAARDLALEIRETAGSVENLRLLRAGEVDVAFLQGGVLSTAAPDPTDAELIALCSVFLEPLWLLQRADAPPLADLRALQGQRVYVGAPGSGSRALADVLLSESGVTGELIPAAAQPADFAAGRADAALLVGSPSSARIAALLADPAVVARSLRRWEAYVRRHRYLDGVTLPEGVTSPADNLPGADIHTVAPAATLAARRSLHPGVIAVLLRAAQDTHAPGDVLSPPGTFPSPDFVELPLSEDARQHFAEGPSFVYRVLPLWVASWLNRLLILAVPLLTLLVPISRIAPPVYRWRIRSQIYQWYELLRDIDRQLDDDSVDAAQCAARLASLERELLDEIDVPLSYMEEFYDLRVHLEMIQAKARRRLSQSDR